ncbi:putative tRNA (uracil-O(2)-)-methyltransferase [Melipona quadrifasciata]|uniref:tRNA (uracil-O(2)-)-methyltransferase n=1 Tax=Melipona quadrifasciata TaxID=166423 RepID=A0A0N0U737_9HYME|nr:putative tRNA (uracil-O(2)-)-methyltransferase [Melipona quadrifasciata]
MDFKTIIRDQSGINALQFFKAIGIWRADRQRDNIDNAKLLDVLRTFDQTAVATASRKIHVHVVKQLPRTPHIFSTGIEFFLSRSEESCVINVHKPFFSHKQPLGARVAFMLQQGGDGFTSVSVYQPNNVMSDFSIEWLKQKLFPCILKWAVSGDSKRTSIPLSSLNLVLAEKYAELYCKLKEKYGKQLIENWPENTDPMKFVYEDIAIAAYLLLLWEKERFETGTSNLQSFIDLGCGNGLLVHILFNEGHRGSGIDLRRRKIWDLYPPETPLQVCTVVPSSSTVYPGVDWIIGNHSDELTPWIPIIAARSSNNCRFFLLPCCPYELNGAKYQRYCASKSQYSEYIDYVKNICLQCGFTTHLDKLRIPSTKRICLIGWERTHEETKNREDRIQQMLSAKTTLTLQKHESSDETIDSEAVEEWTCDFKPRDKVEKVRNCTQLEKTLIASIVDIVSNQLLHEGHAITTEETPKKLWNAGRCLELRKVAESIPRETMIHLRKECGEKYRGEVIYIPVVHMGISSFNKDTYYTRISCSTYPYANACELSSYLWSQTDYCTHDNEMSFYPYELLYENPESCVETSLSYLQSNKKLVKTLIRAVVETTIQPIQDEKVQDYLKT